MKGNWESLRQKLKEKIQKRLDLSRELTDEEVLELIDEEILAQSRQEYLLLGNAQSPVYGSVWIWHCGTINFRTASCALSESIRLPCILTLPNFFAARNSTSGS